MNTRVKNSVSSHAGFQGRYMATSTATPALRDSTWAACLLIDTNGITRRMKKKPQGRNGADGWERRVFINYKTTVENGNLQLQSKCFSTR